MNGYKLLKKNALHFQCRRCINEQYGLKLKNIHCFYMPFPGQCQCCREIRNIVADIPFVNRWRVCRAKKKADPVTGTP